MLETLFSGIGISNKMANILSYYADIYINIILFNEEFNPSKLNL